MRNQLSGKTGKRIVVAALLGFAFLIVEAVVFFVFPGTYRNRYYRDLDLYYGSGALSDTSASNQGGDSVVPVILIIGAAAAGAAVYLKKRRNNNSGVKKDTGKSSGIEAKREEVKKPSVFRLYFYKDFGNFIKRGEAPKYVYARLEEATGDGRKIDRPDLSARISITSGTGGLNVDEYGMSGNWKSAFVSASESLSEEYASVAFRFTGEGGTYTNNVWFRIASNPCIEFPDKDRHAIVHVVNGLFGDGKTYEVRFSLKDFSAQLDTTDIKITARDNDLILSCEKNEEPDEGRQYFKAVILNRSAKNDTRRRCPIMIGASKGEESATGSFYFDLYPEGS